MTSRSGPSTSSVPGTYGVPTRPSPTAAIARPIGSVSAPMATAPRTVRSNVAQSSSAQDADPMGAPDGPAGGRCGSKGE